jgi:hypothetical protein
MSHYLIPIQLGSEMDPRCHLYGQGNGFGITGWAIGVGWTTLINQIMFSHIKSRAYFPFAGLDLL